MALALLWPSPARSDSARSDSPAPPAALKAGPGPGRGQTLTYDFDNARYLLPGRSRGALAYVTEGVAEGAEVPVVVFLHGLNPKGIAHPWFGAPADLRPVVDDLVGVGKVTPFVLAAPSQSRDATVPQILWPAFDLDAFLAATDVALAGRARVDRRRVIVIGHSGGGCNPNGGIIRGGSRGATVPQAVLAVDTCLDDRVAQGLLHLRPETRLFVSWQRGGWSRPFDVFRKTIETADGEGIPRDRHCDDVRGLQGFAHDAILPFVLGRDLPSLLPSSRSVASATRTEGGG